jgi:hypothetical protein
LALVLDLLDFIEEESDLSDLLVEFSFNKSMTPHQISSCNINL